VGGIAVIKTIVAGAFGLLFAWFVWAGVGNFLGIQNQRFQLGLQLTAVGWIVIFLDVLAPIILFVAALLVARKAPIRRFAGTLLVALLLTAVINLDLVLGVPVTAIFATGTAG
jgi:hypothetical protein